MRILGNRVLVSRIEKEKKEGFDTVEVTDSFVYKGRVEQIGEAVDADYVCPSNTVLFAKYSPDTQEVEHEGKKMKVVNVEDIIAIL